MKLLERLDVSAKTWQANPGSRAVAQAPQQPRSALRRQASVGTLEHVQQKQLADEQNRRLKEQRLAELARQLESPELQRSTPQTPHRSHTPAMSQHSLSASLKPASVGLPHAPLYLPAHDDAALWQQKRREVDELNARIESLRLSGMPADQLPSPVHLPMSQLHPDLADRSGSSLDRRTCASSPAIPTAPLAQSVGTDLGPRRTSSRKSLRAPSPHPSKSLGAGLAIASRGDRTDQESCDAQTSYIKALKEAEDLISQLRASHDNLLRKVGELESQQDASEAENEDLRTRTGRLEEFLAREQKARERLEAENARLKAELEDRARALAQAEEDSRVRGHAEANARAQQAEAQLRAQAQARVQQEAAERAYHPQPRQVGRTMTHLRAQLLERDQQLQQQFAHHDLGLDPNDVRQAAPNINNKRSPAHLQRSTSLTPLDHQLHALPQLSQRPLHSQRLQDPHIIPHQLNRAQMYDDKVFHGNHLSQDHHYTHQLSHHHLSAHHPYMQQSYAYY